MESHQEAESPRDEIPRLETIRTYSAWLILIHSFSLSSGLVTLLALVKSNILARYTHACERVLPEDKTSEISISVTTKHVGLSIILHCGCNTINRLDPAARRYAMPKPSKFLAMKGTTTP